MSGRESKICKGFTPSHSLTSIRPPARPTHSRLLFGSAQPPPRYSHPTAATNVCCCCSVHHATPSTTAAAITRLPPMYFCYLKYVTLIPTATNVLLSPLIPHIYYHRCHQCSSAVTPNIPQLPPLPPVCCRYHRHATPSSPMYRGRCSIYTPLKSLKREGINATLLTET